MRKLKLVRVATHQIAKCLTQINHRPPILHPFNYRLLLNNSSSLSGVSSITCGSL